MSRRDLGGDALRALAAVAIVTVATATGRLLDVDLTAAALLLLVAAVLATLLGRVGAIVGTVGGFLALNYFFAAPRDGLEAGKVDEFVALGAFVVASGILSWTVSRLAAARWTAQQRERETQLRLDLTTRLAAGEDPERVVAGTADALVALFSLVECVVRGPGTASTANGPGAPGAVIPVRRAPLEVDATPRRDRPLDSSARALLDALVAGLAAAIDRLHLEGVARDAHVAAQVGRTRSGFLSAVTHNLRTPLASIKAASSTLRAPDLELTDEDRAELLDTIYDETDRLERLVTNILELSRIRAGALDVRRQPVDLPDLARAAIRRLRPLARAHRVRLDIAGSIATVEVDVEMMEQVFGNLLENALKFAPPGSEILVSASVTTDARDVVVRVTDHGPGVPEDERVRIFEEFSRVDARPDGTGTGLGLAIVQALVTAHGGHVWCEATPGGGATFAFDLPALP